MSETTFHFTSFCNCTYYVIFYFVFVLYLCIFSPYKFTILLIFRTGATSSVNFDAIFGPAYKGILLGAVICAALYNDIGLDVGFTYDWKEAKDHGEGGKFVGASMGDKRVLVVDDVITASTVIRDSYDILSSIQAIPVGVVIALDRAEKRALDDPVFAVQAV